MRDEENKSFSGVPSRPTLAIVRSSLRAALSSYLAAGITALALIGLNDGDGINDVSSFLYWSLALAFAIGIVCLLQPEKAFRFGVFIRSLCSIVLGAVVGLICTLIVRKGLGPWFGMFSVPLVYCWMAGGAIGMLSVSSVSWNSSELFLRLCLALVVLSGAIIGGSTSLARGQRLELVFAKRAPGTSLVVSDNERNVFTREELKLLELNGVTGKVSVSSVSAHGEGKTSRILVISDKQVHETVYLPQPKDESLVYVQRQDRWEMLPSNSRTLNRKVRLDASEFNRNETLYSVELATGAQQGGIAFVW